MNVSLDKEVPLNFGSYPDLETLDHRNPHLIHFGKDAHSLIVTVIITSTLLVWYQEKHPSSWQKMLHQPSNISLSLLAKGGKTEKGRVQVCMCILPLRS